MKKDCATMCKALAAITADASEGWILDGFPKTAEQAECMKKEGVMPDALVVVEANSQEIVEFLSRRVVDPATNTLYDTKTNPPPEGVEVIQMDADKPEEIQKKNAPYFEGIDGVKSTFNGCVLSVNGC